MAYHDNWGRRYSYGVMATISVPALKENSVPIQLQKGHLHFGSGADLVPRNISVNQPYNVTTLRKSSNRAHDSLQPPPQAANPALWNMNKSDYKENSLASHQSRFELFPTWRRDDKTETQAIPSCDFDNEDDVVQDDELKLPPLNGNNHAHDDGCDFFSKHRTITSFNQRNPSETPALMTRSGRRPADWHLMVARHTVGR